MNFKFEKNISLIISLFLIMIVLNLAANFYPLEYNRVKIFILDDFLAEGDNYDNFAITHGELVKGVIDNIDENFNLFVHNVSSSEGIREELYLKGLERAIAYKKNNPAKEVIINISLSFSDYSTKHRQLIDQALENKLTVIAAAGNDNLTTPIYPAGFSKVISVANSRRIGKARSSNYGEYIDISAPGDAGGIITGDLVGGFGFSYLHTQGTSFSAPRLVGSLAKLLELDEGLTAQQGMEIIYSSSSTIFNRLYREGKLGSGLLNLNRALRKVNFTYWILDSLANFVVIFLVLIFTIILIKKYRIAGIFFGILLLLVIVPSFLFLSELSTDLTLYMYGGLQAFGFTIKLMLTLVLVLIGVFRLSSWDKKVKLTVSSILVASNFTLLNYDLSKGFNYVILGFGLGLLLVIESLLYYNLKQSNDLELVISKLASNSKKIRKLAQNKLLKWDDLAIKPLVVELEKTAQPCKISLLVELLAANDFANTSQIIADYLYHPQREVYVTAFKQLASSYQYTEKLISFANKKQLTKEELLAAFKNADREVIKKLLLYLKRENRDNKTTAISILKQLDCQIVVSVLEEILTKEFDFELLWQLFCDCKIKSLALSHKLINLIHSADSMWLRYYVLRLLARFHPTPTNIKPLLEILSESEQELLQLEAENILSEFDS